MLIYVSLTGLNQADNPMMAALLGEVPYRVKFDYLTPALQPINSIMSPWAPTVNPTKTYDSAIKEGIQYDILWVPAGMSSCIIICLCNIIL